MTLKSFTKAILQPWPYTAELYQSWLAQDKLPAEGYRLDRLARYLPGWVHAAESARRIHSFEPSKRVLIIGCLPWWVEYITAMGLLLSGVGHEVEIAYSPYRRWTRAVTPFESRRQGAIIRDALQPVETLVRLHDLTVGPTRALHSTLEEALRELSWRDVQYSMQREELDDEPDSEDRALFDLRFSRNRLAAQRILKILDRQRFSSVIIPNGSILEFGAAMLAARFLNVPVSTFEFGEQRERLWLSQNDEVMRQDTSALWRDRGEIPLTEDESLQIHELYRARTKGATWEQFGRKWQRGDSQGAQLVRNSLDLVPDKPLILLCTNVVGDSLALGRQTFTEGMSDWLSLTVQHLAKQNKVQLVIRVHPGELLGAGHPSTEIVSTALPEMPANIKVISPDSAINTYDLIELADLGLVYTTTVGLEMAMWGVPVVVAGQTHYRGKGFTEDPESLESYFSTVDRIVRALPGSQLEPEKVELAWRYAYRFFFEFPFRFPWHLIGFWDDVEERPMNTVLQDEQRSSYCRTISALVGNPIHWNAGGMR